MLSEHLKQLQKHHRRRLMIELIVRMVATVTLLMVVYYALPLGGFKNGGAVALLVAAAIAFIGVLLWQLRRIVGAPYPGLRAIESFAVIVPLAITLFSVIYVKMSHASSGSFSQPLTHTSALYFTTTVLSTVGFGDITPVTDTARLVVMLQMLLDLVLIGALVRLLFGAARRGLEQKQTSPAADVTVAASAPDALQVARAEPGVTETDEIVREQIER